MAVYPTWKIRYGVGIETAAWGTGVAAGTKMPTGAPMGIWMTDLNIDFNSGQEFIDTRKATGVSYRKTGEYLQSLKKPSASFTWEANAYNVAPFFYGLFHKLAAATVVEAAGSPYVKTFLVYGLNPDYALVTGGTTPNWATNDIPMSLSLTKDLFQNATAESHRLEGCVPSSIKLAGSEGQPLMITVDLIAKDYDFAVDASTGTYTPVTAASLMWQDATFMLASGAGSGAAGTLTAINCTSWEANFTNNCVFKFGDSQTGNRVIFGNFGMTGSFTIPWDGENTLTDDYVAGTDRMMFVYWGDGTVSSAGEFNVVANVRFTSVEMGDADGETTMTVNYEAVLDGTNHSGESGALPTTSPVQVQVADGLDYGAVA